MKFSIIVPVFNSSIFIEKCLDNLFNQKTDLEYEVIAIDDNSSDNSFELLHSYTKKETRLKVIKNLENKRPYLARAIAADSAIGDYIIHCDIDDFLNVNSLNIFYEHIKKHDPDVLIYNYSKQSKKFNEIVYDIKKSFFTKDVSKVLKFMLGMSATKVVKRKIVNSFFLKL